VTEAEWLTGRDAEGMLDHLATLPGSRVGRFRQAMAKGDRTAAAREYAAPGSSRKHRLFSVACARDEFHRARDGLGWFNFGDPVPGPLPSDDLADVYAAHEAMLADVEAWADGGPRPRHSGFLSWYVLWPCHDEVVALAALGHDPEELAAVSPERVAAIIGSYRTHPAHLIRDVFGNPFRAVTPHPDWLTPSAVAIARQMYESREFSAMPILADALQDAGCEDEQLLGHCRGPGPHVRGCWVVDLVLGKG
jgi:hypothetical protein